MQMASAARLASSFPQVGAAAASAVPGGAARRVPGHRARAARRAVVAVRRRRRRRPGADRRRRPDPVDLRLARRVGDQPAAVHHRLPALGRHARADAGAADQLAQSAARTASGQRGVRGGAAPLRRGAGPAAAARTPQPGTIRCALLSDVAAERDWVADQSAQHLPRKRQAPRRRRRCWCAATPMPRRWPTRSPRAACRSRSSVSPGCSPCPRSPTWSRRCGWSADPTAGAAAMRVLTGPRWRLGGRDIAALWRRAVELDDRRPRGRTTRRPSRSSRRPRRTPTRPAWPTRSAIPGPPAAYSAVGYARIVALGRELTALRAHLAHPLPELVAEVRRVLGVDAESPGGPAGLGGLDRAPSTSTRSPTWWPTSPRGPARPCRACWRTSTPPNRWRTGWRPPRCPSPHDRVQILTVHAAKGLEWQVVAVPHLSGRVFPSTGVDAHLAHRRGRSAAAAAR